MFVDLEIIKFGSFKQLVKSFTQSNPGMIFRENEMIDPIFKEIEFDRMDLFQLRQIGTQAFSLLWTIKSGVQDRLRESRK